MSVCLSIIASECQRLDEMYCVDESNACIKWFHELNPNPNANPNPTLTLNLNLKWFHELNPNANQP